MVLRLIPRSPRRRIPVCHRRPRIKVLSARLDRLASANLTPATGARTTRFCRTQKAPIILHAADRSRGSSRPAIANCAPDALTSTASRPAFVTIAIRPSVGQDGFHMQLIWVRREAKYFCKRGLTRFLEIRSDLPVGQSLAGHWLVCRAFQGLLRHQNLPFCHSVFRICLLTD